MKLFMCLSDIKWRLYITKPLVLIRTIRDWYLLYNKHGMRCIALNKDQWAIVADWSPFFNASTNEILRKIEKSKKEKRLNVTRVSGLENIHRVEYECHMMTTELKPLCGVISPTKVTFDSNKVTCAACKTALGLDQ